ncbi:MAG: S9 family peptidase [Lentimicrobiaceae bacterium]
MRKLVLTLFITLQIAFVFAQGKMLVPEDIMSSRKLYPTGLINIQWQGNSGYYTWQEATLIMQGNVTDETKDTLFTLNTFNELLQSAGKEAVKRVPSINWKDNQSFTFSIDNDYFTCKNGKLLQDHSLPQEAENAEAAPVTNYMAYTLNNNLYISTGSKQLTITNDKDKGIVNGQTVHRNEFGISKGTFWSPEGTQLAFYRMDETMVTEYPIVDITARVAELKSVRYPMAGMTSHQVTVGIYDIQTGSTIFLKTGEPKDQYLTNIAWSPDQKYLFIAVLNRDQNHMKLNQYEVSTGNFVKTLFEEKNDRYVEPQHPMVFIPGNNEQFIWQSQRDGFNHLYLYNINGQLMKQMTSGKWVITEMLGFDEPAKGIFFTSTAISPTQDQLFYVDLKTSKVKQLTSDTGNHYPRIRPDGKYFITSYNNLKTPSTTLLVDTKNRKSRLLHKSDNPLKDYKLGQTSIFTIKADDNTDLYCRLIKPADFDSTKKYPVIVYVYGGPHAQMVTESWMSGGLFLQYLAQKGYVVFTLDNRGSSNRGFEFESIIHRRVGEIEKTDQMQGIKYLKSLPYVNADRIGIDGWSYGGFMSVNLKLSYPEVFKVATAGGPVCDWKYYEVMYGERYMDTPEQNPEGYKNASLVEHADQLQGKLMIIHGGIDNTVVWQQSQAFVKACIDNKKQLDYFVYPTHEHNVSGIDRAHLFRKIAGYFDENL